MKKTFLTFGLFIACLCLQAQKIEHDKKSNQVTIDGQAVFRLTRENCGFEVDCHFEAFDADNNKVIRVNYKDFTSPSEISRSNPNGTVRYYEYLFLETKQRAEMDFFAISPKSIAKVIIANNLILNGKLNQKAVDEFVLVHGTPFAERLKNQK